MWWLVYLGVLFLFVGGGLWWDRDVGGGVVSGFEEFERR